MFEDRGLAAVSEALQEVVDADGYLDAYLATTASAAAEFVAAANGDATGLSEEAQKAYAAFAGDKAALAAAKPLAHQAMSRILGPNSELIELWEEDGPDTDDCKAAKAALAALQGRVA